jgi:spore germination protein PF
VKRVPSSVGAFKITTNSGQIVIGDTFLIAPRSASKSYNGSGTGNTGDFAASYNLFSWTNTVDADNNDQPSVGLPVPVGQTGGFFIKKSRFP